MSRLEDVFQTSSSCVPYLQLVLDQVAEDAKELRQADPVHSSTTKGWQGTATRW